MKHVGIWRDLELRRLNEITFPTVQGCFKEFVENGIMLILEKNNFKYMNIHDVKKYELDCNIWGIKHTVIFKSYLCASLRGREKKEAPLYWLTSQCSAVPRLGRSWEQELNPFFSVEWQQPITWANITAFQEMVLDWVYLAPFVLFSRCWCLVLRCSFLPAETL